MESQIGRFLFQKRNEKIDWRKLASVDVDRIAHEVDVDAIQDNILSVTYCNIEHELGYHSLDTNFIKLFRLSQLTIEYLLHCQEYLQQCLEDKENQINLAHEKVQCAHAEQNEVKAELSKRNEAYKNLKKELQKCRKLISDYQLMIRAGANGLHRCSCCNKSFVSEYYLRSHVERRHPEEASKSHYPLPASHTYRNDTDLQNELNDIKTRLHTTETELKYERDQINAMKRKDSEIRDSVIEEFKAEHEQWKFTEQEKMRIEMESYKEMIMEELRQTQKEKEVLQKNLIELQQSTGKKKSTLGILLDDSETEEGYMERQQQKMEKAMAEMKEKYSIQIKELVKEHSKELKEERALRETMQEKMDENNRIYLDEIKELKEMLLLQQQKNKAGIDQVDFNKAKPPITPTSTPIQPLQPEAPIRDTTGITPVKSTELPEKDSITLWVSSRTNGHQSFRVFREPASTKGNWKDLFTFNALLQPSGEFNKPLHVFSCGGSPYWRQYVSIIEEPPKPNYRHDFTFYVCATKYIGTIKLRVVETGNAEVIRSCITKDDVMIPNWKDTGVVFYALKNKQLGSSIKGVSRSGTFNSDVFESISDDDMSLSSFTGTDLVKQNLAEEIKRSRENLLEDETDKRVHEQQQQHCANDDVNDDVIDDAKEKTEDGEDDANENEAESNFDGTSSGSLLGTSLLPPRGEFYPFLNNRLARANYDHPKERLDEERENILEFLEDNLEKHGVDLNETSMPNSIYKSKIKTHNNEILMIEKQYSGFGKLRANISKAIDDHARKWLDNKKKSFGSKLKKTAQVIKAASNFKNKENRDLPKPVSRDTSQEVVIHHYRGNDEEESEDSYDDEDSIQEVDGKHVTSASVHGSYMGSSDKPVNNPVIDDRGIGQDEDDEDEFAVSESSQWDTGGEEEDTAPRVTESQPAEYQEEVYNPKMRSPKGEKVKKLAANLEASLTLRDPSRKKLAGAVDLLNVDDGNTQNKSLYGDNQYQSTPKRTVSFRNNLEDFDDDESDFSLTPPNERKNINTRARNDDDFDENEDIDELLEAYGANKPTFSKPSASSTPHKPVHSGSNNTPVTALNVDDFDDDDSF